MPSTRTAGERCRQDIPTPCYRCQFVHKRQRLQTNGLLCDSCMNEFIDYIRKQIGPAKTKKEEQDGE